MNETIEIIKEARKSGMQTACLLFATLVLVLIAFGGLFAFYIYKSYDNTVVGISAVQDGTNNNQEVTNGETIN